MTNLRVALIFDGDDTLWKTQALYEKAKQQFFAIMELQGFDRQAVKEKLAQVDIENVAAMGFSQHRFPESMVKVYEYFCRVESHSPNPRVREKSRQIGYSVFTEKPKLMDNARLVLHQLSKSCDLYLYTAGDFAIQKSKLEELNLRNFFKAIYITTTKDESNLQNIIDEQALKPEYAWMIGNSLRSDINPALNVGLKCIWVQSDSWEYDQASLVSGRLWKVNNLIEIPSLLNSFYDSD